MIKVLGCFCSCYLLLIGVCLYGQDTRKNALGIELVRPVSQFWWATKERKILIPEIAYRRQLSKRFFYRSIYGYTWLKFLNENLNYGQHGIYMKQGIDFRVVGMGQRHELIAGIAGFITYHQSRSQGFFHGLYFPAYQTPVFENRQWFGGWELATRINKKFSDVFILEFTTRLGFLPQYHSFLFNSYLSGLGYGGDVKGNHNSGKPSLIIFPGIELKLYYRF